MLTSSFGPNLGGGGALPFRFSQPLTSLPGAQGTQAGRKWLLFAWDRSFIQVGEVGVADYSLESLIAFRVSVGEGGGGWQTRSSVNN